MRPEAAALYTRGLERFATRDYAAAVADFEAGYAIDPRREFLFAEGQAKRLAGDCKGAVALYQRFLATNPTGVQANATQMALGRCAQHLADHPEVVVVQHAAPAAPASARRRSSGGATRSGSGFTGAGVVGVGVGIGFIAASYAARHDAEQRAVYDPYDQRWSTAESRWQVGVGTLALGTALTAHRRRAFRGGAPAGARVRPADRRVGRTGPVAGRRRVLIGAGARVAAAGVLALLLPFAARAWARATSTARSTRSARSARPRGTCEAERPLQSPRSRTARRRTGATSTARAATPTRACPATCAAQRRSTQRAARGGGHACLVRADDSLWCWGRNDHGQIGDGTRTPRALPVRVAAIDARRRAVAAGDLHTCAVTTRRPPCSAGAPTTAASSATLGGDDRGLPQQVAGRDGLTGDRRARRRQGLFLRARRRPRRALLGRRQPRPARRRRRAGPAPARRWSPGLSATSRSCRREWQHACARATPTARSSAGARTPAVRSATARRAARVRRPRRPPPAARAQVTAVATGRDHTCALAADGLYCWGAQRAGAGESGAAEHADPDAPGGDGSSDVTDPIDIAAGAQHTCIVREGERTTSPAGARTRAASSATAPPIGERDRRRRAGAASRARSPATARSSAGATTTTASSRSAATPCARRPRPFPGLAHVGALAAGGAHNCATADDANGARALFCWGANGSSQLGNGSSTDAPAAARIVVAGTRSASRPARAHTCAFAADKTAACWGSGRLRPARPADPGSDMVITSRPSRTSAARRAATASTRWRPARRTPASARRSRRRSSASASTATASSATG